MQSDSSLNTLPFSLRQLFKDIQNHSLYPMDFLSMHLSYQKTSSALRYSYWHTVAQSPGGENTAGEAAAISPCRANHTLRPCL